MAIFGRVVRWLRGRPVWAGNRYDPEDKRENARNSPTLPDAKIPLTKQDYSN